MSSLFENIDITAYQEQFEQNDSIAYLLLDVRETNEYVQGHLPGAVNLPLSELQVRIHEVEKEQAIVLVCARGRRSAMAAEFMASVGYTQLYNLVDGTLGWMMQGLPLDTEDS